MTRYEKSDAQLDAEAEARPRIGAEVEEKWTCWICDPRDQDKHGRYDLPARLHCHRWAYRTDCVIPRLATRQPPTVFDFEKADWQVEDGSRSGMPMSGSLLRRLDNPGAQFPWSAGFRDLWVNCRRHHYHHRAADKPYWRGRLCWEAVKLTVVGGEKRLIYAGPLTPEDAGAVLRIDHITELLLQAFDDIEAGMKRAEQRAERRAREDAGQGPGPFPVPVHEHKALPGLHALDCSNPICKASRAA